MAIKIKYNNLIDVESSVRTLPTTWVTSWKNWAYTLYKYTLK